MGTDICLRVKKIMKFLKRKPRSNVEILYMLNFRVWNFYRRNYFAFGYESVIVEVHWNNINKFAEIVGSNATGGMDICL